MIKKLLLFTLLFTTTSTALVAAEDVETSEDIEQLDTVAHIEQLEVTAIKQGLDLRGEALSFSLLGRAVVEQNRVTSLKDASSLAPNIYIPDYGSRITSSIYVRGLGSRIDQPVVGLTVDNVPVLNKDNYDFEMADIERIELLRGPQSAMYGRNTMGGVINVYTISPLKYQGFRGGVEYGNQNSIKGRLGYYDKSENGRLGWAITGYYTQSDGFFTNQYNGDQIGAEKMGGGRARVQYRSLNGVTIDNNLSFSMLEQDGYAYQKVGSTSASYNDPCTFERTNLSNGLTVEKRYKNFTLSSISSYQYSFNDLLLDNDFTEESYFTLNQITKENSVTQDILFKKIDDFNGGYNWLLGAFGFFRHTSLSGPVLFKSDGIDSLIIANANEYNPQYNYIWSDETLLLESDFTIPNYGMSLYHKSTYEIERFKLSAELRVDYESSTLNYTNYTIARYTMINKDDSSKQYPKEKEIDNNESITQHFVELLPKISAIYSLNSRGALFATISKGYKAGGFNTQMFSDVLQQQLMDEMGAPVDVYNTEDIITYKPEYSWNYEVGGNLSWIESGILCSFSLFYIDCFDQQLTQFPEGTTTGRMMTNAGRTRSFGAEASVGFSPNKNFNLNCDYGYTNAKFVNYYDGKEQYAGKFIPYSPSHTLSARANWSIPLPLNHFNRLTFGAGVSGVGAIYWDESNTVSQPFYTLYNSSIKIENSSYSIELWGKNLSNQEYSTFYFESIGNQFTQQGKPITFGVTVNFNINKTN